MRAKEPGIRRDPLVRGRAAASGLFVLLVHRKPALLRTAQPGVDLVLGLILLDAVQLLDATGQLLATPCNDGQVIVAQLAPLRARLALELAPLALDAVPVHFISLQLVEAPSVRCK